MVDGGIASVALAGRGMGDGGTPEAGVPEAIWQKRSARAAPQVSQVWRGVAGPRTVFDGQNAT